MSNISHQSRLESLLQRWRETDTTGVEFPADETGHSEMPLSRMRPGDIGHVLSLKADCDARQHLMELGFIAGTEVQVLRIAPLGDPLTVRIRGYQLSLRRREAEAVWVRRCPAPSISEDDDCDDPRGK